MHSVAVSSGAEALVKLAETKESDDCFDLILLDICMPKMNGFDFMKQLQAKEELIKQKIVVLSSAGSPDVARQCREMGVKEYVTKPVSQHELLNAIIAAMSGNSFRHASVQRQTPDSSVGLSPLKILVVEDNLVNQKLVLSLLKKWHHRATVAENGLVAIEKYQQENFDLILMDMQMPEMGGIEATQQIRLIEAREKNRQHTPIVAMTANVMPGDWERCLEAGMDHYLSKPIKSSLLENLLSQYQVASPMVIERTNDMTGISSERNKQSGYFDYEQALQSADQEIIHIIANSFLDVYDQYIADLAHAIAVKSPELLHRSAHTIKGVVSNFCAYPIEELAYKLECKGKENNFENTSELLSDISDELYLLTIAVRKLIDADVRPTSE